MALTITAVPSSFPSLHDNAVFTVADAAKVTNPTTYPNFKFIGDIYMNGAFAARIRKVPDPVTGIGIFNVSSIIRNYISIVFNPATSLLAKIMGTGDFANQITMHFGESYGGTDYLDMTLDPTRYFFNHYNDKKAGSPSSLIPKVLAFATNRPLSGDVLYSSNYYLIPYFAQSTNLITATITPSGGSPVTTSFSPTQQQQLMILNVSPGAINSDHPGTIGPGTPSYTVKVTNPDNPTLSTTFTVNIICEAIYQPYMIHFLNQYGGFDSKLFTKVSRKTIASTKSDFGKIPYRVASDGSVSYTSGVAYNTTRATYASQYTEKLSLNSDILNDSEYAWLRDLIISPMVFIEADGYIFPITITDSTYESKKVVNDNLTNLLINIEFGNQLNAQYL